MAQLPRFPPLGGRSTRSKQAKNPVFVLRQIISISPTENKSKIFLFSAAFLNTVICAKTFVKRVFFVFLYFICLWEFVTIKLFSNFSFLNCTKRFFPQ